MKRCTRCKQDLPVASFSKDKTRGDGLQASCKRCNQLHRKPMPKQKSREYQAAHRKRKTKEQQKNTELRHKYGIDLETFVAMEEQQEGRCAICERIPDETLCLDHDHDTGEVRGLLCRKCNAGLRLLGDNKEGIQKALDYLKGTE